MEKRWFQTRTSGALGAMFWLGLALETWRHNYHLNIYSRPFETLSVFVLFFAAPAIALGVLLNRARLGLILGFGAVLVCTAIALALTGRREWQIWIERWLAQLPSFW